MSQGKRARLREPAADPAARALVHEIRRELVELFVAHGAASNQIGKTYPYLSVLRPESRALLEGLKQQLDPGGALNPGALELSAG
jgi:FAD/FMN-containing dehydrogenase